jgi:hypothetical protein
MLAAGFRAPVRALVRAGTLLASGCDDPPPLDRGPAPVHPPQMFRAVLAE